MSKINIVVNNRAFKVDKGITLGDIAKLLDSGKKQYVAAIVDNIVRNLSERIEEDSIIDLLDLSSKDGYNILTRTITIVFLLAAKRVVPNKLAYVEHFIGDGLYYELDKNEVLKHKEIEKIKLEMEKIIKADYPIKRKKVTIDDAYKIFEKEGYHDKIRLYKSLDMKEIDIYEVNGHYFTMHGYVAPKTGFVKKFDLISYFPGAISLIPTRNSCGDIPIFKEEKSLAKLFALSKRWTDLLDIGLVASINEKIDNGEIDFLVEVSEAYYENQISKIADEIVLDSDINVVQIAGPSSSGKTTTSHRLSVQLGVRGKDAIAIHMDDYFVNREDTPLNEKGEKDYESLGAIDLAKFNEDIMALIEGEEIELPLFDFVEGVRKSSGIKVKLKENSIIVIEGIHGLNPGLTQLIPEKNKYKIYVSALTQLNIDAHNRISTTDMRLLRRMVRDNKYRGNPPEKTIREWPSVREGERKYIFPYQDLADASIDSSLIYEIPVLKKIVIELFDKIDTNSEYYKEVKRLQAFLKYFKTIEDNSIVPINSILREFIGKRG